MLMLKNCCIYLERCSPLRKCNIGTFNRRQRWSRPEADRYEGKGVNKAISQMRKEASSYYLVKTILYIFATCIILRTNFLIVYISLLFESVLCSVAFRVSHTLLEDGCRALSSIIWGVDAQLRGMFRCDDCDVQPSAGGSRVPIACRDEVYSFIESGDHYLRHHDARGEGIS